MCHMHFNILFIFIHLFIILKIFRGIALACNGVVGHVGESTLLFSEEERQLEKRRSSVVQKMWSAFVFFFVGGRSELASRFTSGFHIGASRKICSPLWQHFPRHHCTTQHLCLFALGLPAPAVIRKDRKTGLWSPMQTLGPMLS